MNPLIGIAVAVFPEILKLLVNNVGSAGAAGTGNVSGNSSGIEAIVEQIIKAVTSATGTNNPEEAKQKIANDPAVATDLQVKLAQIALDAHKADLDAAQAQSQEELDLGKIQLDNTMSARTALSDMLKEKTPIVWTPAVISYIVVAGFLIILSILMFGPLDELTKDATILQIINLCVGALISAFSTVISFWLGSSLGSKNKEGALIQGNTVQQAKTLTDNLRAPPPRGSSVSIDGNKSDQSKKSINTEEPLSLRGKYGALVPGGYFSSNPSGSPRSVATNNPGALDYSKWQTMQPGYLGVTHPDHVGNVTTIYRTPEHGIAAWYSLVHDRYHLPDPFTLEDLAKKYAGDDAPATAIAVYIVGWTHWSKGAFDAHATFSPSDISQMVKLGRAMFNHEAGEVSPVGDDQIEYGIKNSASMPA